MNDLSLHDRLVCVLTRYDEKQRSKRGYNCYALAQYFARIDDVCAEIEKGATVRSAILRGFNGRLLTICLKTAGDPDFTREEQDAQGYCY